MRVIEKNSRRIAFAGRDEYKQKLITDEQSALDLMMDAKYGCDSSCIAIDKGLVAEDFFILSTSLAGTILQKFSDYGCRIAIFGDYSRYTSKPLRDFMLECSRGRSVCFAATADEAIDFLAFK